MPATPGSASEGFWPFLLACRNAPAAFAGLLCRRALEVAGAAATAVYEPRGTGVVCLAAAGTSSLNGHVPPLVRAAIESGGLRIHEPSRLPLFEEPGLPSVVACVPFASHGGGRTYVIVVEAPPGAPAFAPHVPQGLLELARVASLAAPSVIPPAPGAPALHDPEGRRARHGLRFLHSRLVGESPALIAMLKRLDIARSKEGHVLLTGETGTGKEPSARGFAEEGVSVGREFVPVSCPNVVATLLESELFGHEKGAFSGAISATRGLLGSGRSLLLFLDEIGDVPRELQPKLLRVADTGEFRTVGGTKLLKAEVRIVAATSRDLEAAMAKGEFLPDLYYRLAANPIRIPALRERFEDIPLLWRHFLGASAPPLDAATLGVIRGHTWPGNLREFSDTIAWAVHAADGGPLGPALRAEIEYRSRKPGAATALSLAGFRERPNDDKASLIRAELDRNGGDQAAVRKALGYSDEGFRKLLIRLGLRRAPGEEA